MPTLENKIQNLKRCFRWRQSHQREVHFESQLAPDLFSHFPFPVVLIFPYTRGSLEYVEARLDFQTFIKYVEKTEDK